MPLALQRMLINVNIRLCKRSVQMWHYCKSALLNNFIKKITVHDDKRNSVALLFLATEMVTKHLLNKKGLGEGCNRKVMLIHVC